MDFENNLALGNGVYTPAEIAVILNIPKNKVSYWLSTYWDGKLGDRYQRNYSWKVNNSKAVSFHTLVEFYVMMQLSEVGVKPREVLSAHEKLTSIFNTSFPFANKDALNSIRTEGRKIYFNGDVGVVTLDGTNQLNLEIIQQFFRKLDFGNDEVATRLWPLGKDHHIVVDPARKFGHPVIKGTNIYPETIADSLRAGDSKEYLSAIYNITEVEISDAILFCKNAA